MESEQFAQLPLSALAAAQLYGCEAELKESERFPLAPGVGIVGLKIIVSKRSPSGEFHVRERHVLLSRGNLGPAVARIVREAAMTLPDTDTRLSGRNLGS